MEKYAVTINFHGHYGYIEYDREKKTAEVHLDAEAPKTAVEKYLREPHTVAVPVGPTIRDFQEMRLDPLENVDSLELCLTRMWDAIDVRVEWSMPPGMAENL